MSPLRLYGPPSANGRSPVTDSGQQDPRPKNSFTVINSTSQCIKMIWVQHPEVKMYHRSEHSCSLVFCLVHALMTCAITTDVMQPTKPKILRICPYPTAPSESNKLDRGILWQSKGSCSPHALQRPQVRLGPASSSMRPLAGQMTLHIQDQREVPHH